MRILPAMTWNISFHKTAGEAPSQCGHPEALCEAWCHQVPQSPAAWGRGGPALEDRGLHETQGLLRPWEVRSFQGEQTASTQGGPEPGRSQGAGAWSSRLPPAACGPRTQAPETPTEVPWKEGEAEGSLEGRRGGEGGGAWP